MRRLGWHSALSIACLALGAAPAAAQGAYPNRPIRVLIPYAPGGLTDVVARHYAEQLRKSLGQNVLVENKPGASGIIAIEEMARAKPDGYTIMVGNISTNCLTPVLLAKRMRINYDRDVQIIARLADAPVFFMATTTNFPPKTFAEFIDYAKAHPGDVRYASAGIGAYQHVNTEILAKRAGGLKLVHIPFKDGGSGILQGCRRRRHPCVVVQRHQPGRHDQGRQGAPARGRGAGSGCRRGRTCRRSTSWASPASGRRNGRRRSRRPACRARSSTSCTRRSPRRRRRRRCRRSSRRAA